MAPSKDNTVYFWRPEGPNGFLGQWYPSKFTWNKPATERDAAEVLHYENAEQFMMYRKGLLFAPEDETTEKILARNARSAPHPRDLRALGRKIPNFSDEVWKKHRYEFVVEGNYLKFSQNADLKAQLLATGDSELVEASPRDRIWGVGFGAENAPNRREKWGLNLLGKALMEVRERIRKEDAANAS